MAGDWIKMDTDLPDKPEVVRMAGILSMDRFAIVGRLHRLWSWWNKHTSNGHALGVTEAFLDELVNRDGFSAALREVQWLESQSDSLAIPRFERHNGNSAKSRAQATERQRKSRSDRDDCHAVSVTKTRPEKRREEKTRKKENKSRGTEYEVKQFAVSLGLPESDGEACFLKWEGNGWTNKGEPVKCWKSTMRNWKIQNFLPSQKPQSDLFGKPAKTYSHPNSYNEPTSLDHL